MAWGLTDFPLLRAVGRWPRLTESQQSGPWWGAFLLRIISGPTDGNLDGHARATRWKRRLCTPLLLSLNCLFSFSFCGTVTLIFLEYLGVLGLYCLLAVATPPPYSFGPNHSHYYYFCIHLSSIFISFL